MSDTSHCCQPDLPGTNTTQNGKEEQGNPTCMRVDPTSVVSGTPPTSMLTGRRTTWVVALKDLEEVSADNFRTHSRSSANSEESLIDPELQGKHILENKLEPSTYLADLWLSPPVERQHRLQRRQLSVGSLGVEPVPLDIKLRDFDLARVAGTGAPGGPQGTERTGNIAFMALDLLTSEYWEGNVERLYRHDLEGFVWVVAAYAWLYDENGVAVKSSPVQDWFTCD
ncbi:hypothetical protein FOMPIDRAFT_88391 [Fomitopsis schrenkii]|uniref:Uncharacterized protein n=1 Tax=Fomitopsis schrenkii TaxID=2126942 RepID=S8FQ50_FOMSC|nr:hypothetical protein FOMPIDRAFT_88391 [Fomitopsis schrenkii]